MKSLYSTLLGKKFLQLSPVLQRFHSGQEKVWCGEARVDWSKSGLIRMLLKIGGLPREADRSPVTVCITGNKNSETWQRHFGYQAIHSRQQLRDQSLYECFGPVSLALSNHIERGELIQTCVRSRLFGVSLPSSIEFKVTAREWQVHERFHFDVEIGIAKSLIIRYRGWLAPQGGVA